MKRTILKGATGALVATALMLTGCNQAAPDTHDADVKAIKDNETQWNADWAAKDVDKLVAHYADDAVLMSPGMASASGKDAIRTTLKGMAADPAVSLKFQASKVEVAKSGDVGYTQGAYQMTMTDPASKQVINDHGSYVTTYRKATDGSWKAVADIATSEVPPPAPAAPAKKK
ncbi:MAG TPA: SgcJ/EcaC family oxidoreductase [Bryobacteraceae bacterium]|nr:SgcJ/EcaC family oxidoreductase [Bryobacteraceae bacterium]